MRRLFLIFFLISFCSFSQAQEYLDVTKDSRPQFPEDFFFKKDYRIQWWYFTGHLFDPDGREFGYELTFFTVNIQKRVYKSRFGVNRIYISHFAVSDIAGQRFLFSDKTDAGVYDFAGAKDDRLHVWTGQNVLDGTTTKMHIRASDKDKAINLQLTPLKPVVLNGENGYSRKSVESPLVASLYFSYTNLETEGELKIGNKVFRVKGKSWFDREISSRGLAKSQAGWEWFAIQLDSGSEIMLYILRNKDGSVDPYSAGTFIYPDGKYKHISNDDLSVKILARYTSRHTGARYPSEWEVRIPSEKVVMRIIPLLEDQEVLAYDSTGNYYWEGDCRVEGSAEGRAYVEMTGY
jgi:predicted secreted hydrolase